MFFLSTSEAACCKLVEVGSGSLLTLTCVIRGAQKKKDLDLSNMPTNPDIKRATNKP